MGLAFSKAAEVVERRAVVYRTALASLRHMSKRERDHRASAYVEGMRDLLSCLQAEGVIDPDPSEREP